MIWRPQDCSLGIIGTMTAKRENPREAEAFQTRPERVELPTF